MEGGDECFCDFAFDILLEMLVLHLLLFRLLQIFEILVLSQVDRLELILELVLFQDVFDHILCLLQNCSVLLLLQRGPQVCHELSHEKIYFVANELVEQLLVPRFLNLLELIRSLFLGFALDISHHVLGESLDEVHLPLALQALLDMLVHFRGDKE